MSKVLLKLIEHLALERIEENLFVGQSRDLGWGAVFGGQVLGQALSAATQTVPEERVVHSLHSYFLRPGDVSKPIVYDVDRIRDGKSFTTRRVVAIQHGRPIFNLSASFQVPEVGFEHHDEMPKVEGPDGLASDHELVAQIADQIADQVPEALLKRAMAPRPIEIRPVEPLNPFNPAKKPPRSCVWYRAAAKLPDKAPLHRYLLAYASDFHFLVTAMRPHGVSWMMPGMQVASLDHAMWFHRDFRLDDWLLHVVESPSASQSRGLARGRFFTRDGVLVASTMQEGLMRARDTKLLSSNWRSANVTPLKPLPDT